MNRRELVLEHELQSVYIENRNNLSFLKTFFIVVRHRMGTHLDHSFKGNQHRSEMFIDGEKMKEPSEVEDVTDCEQCLAHVNRIPCVPIKAICS